MSLNSIQHYILNSMYWAENPNFELDPGSFDNVINKIGAYPGKLIRMANLDLTGKLKNLLVLDPESVVGMGGESITVLNKDDNTVSKYMFRTKGDPNVVAERVREQYEITRSYLGKIALETEIDVEKVKLFKLGRAVSVITQKQPYLSPDLYQDLFSSRLYLGDEIPEKMRAGLKTIVDGWKRMKSEQGMYPDVSSSTYNLFVDSEGNIRLVDILPMPISGPRLAGGNPPRRSHARTIRDIESKLG
ncbi:hypothetical protein CR969_00335 [Candidatus Saccharibacteria bacterium]|nr:MAG: hypothetical protein CR969_00335 [Candidatus Saccharibacteria bacterium]